MPHPHDAVQWRPGSRADVDGPRGSLESGGAIWQKKQVGSPSTPQTERNQTCLGCGAVIHLPKRKEAPLCFRCRATHGGALEGNPVKVPFQKIASPEARPGGARNLRLTALLFALAVIVAVIVYLPAHRAPAPATGSQA